MNWQKFCRFCENLGNYTLWRIFFINITFYNRKFKRNVFSSNKLYFRPQARAVRQLAIPSAEICCMVTTPSSSDLQIKALCTFHGNKNIQLYR